MCYHFAVIPILNAAEPFALTDGGIDKRRQFYNCSDIFLAALDKAYTYGRHAAPECITVGAYDADAEVFSPRIERTHGDLREAAVVQHAVVTPVVPVCERNADKS